MIYYVIAFAAGLGITLQTTINSQLARGLGGDSVTAAFFHLLLALLALEFTHCCVGDYSHRLQPFLLSLCGVLQVD